MKKNITLDEIDDLLPQTQCRLCEFSGCRPYAEAMIADVAPIDRCLPGGVETLQALALKLEKEAHPYIEAMRQKTKAPSYAVIREEECIGCTKCIQACPTDAIIGAAKKMHTVITDACTGCELCIEPCPVDCIDMVTLPLSSPIKNKHKADIWRARYQQHNARNQHANSNINSHLKIESLSERQAEIQAAIARALAKKTEKTNG